MRQLTIYSFCFIFLLSCNKSLNCKGDDEIKGEIIDDINLSCNYVGQQANDNTYIIKSLNDLIPNSTSEECENSVNVDFNKYSIIGQRIDGQCKMKIIHDLKIDHDTKKYTLTSKVKEFVFCKSQIISTRLLLVPAIPEDYSVEFEID